MIFGSVSQCRRWGPGNPRGIMHPAQKPARHSLKPLEILSRHLGLPVTKTGGDGESGPFLFEPGIGFSLSRVELKNRLIEGQVQKAEKRLALFSRTRDERFLAQLWVEVVAKQL